MRPRGFTLVEVVVAATLLATTVAVVFGALVTARQFAEPEIERGVEANLGREKLDSLYEAVRQDWWNAPDQPLTPDINLPPENITLDGRDYQRHYTVQTVAGKDYRRGDFTAGQ